MKLKRILTICTVAATLYLSADTLLAQAGGGGGNGGGGNGGGGGGRGGQGGGGQGGQTGSVEQQALQKAIDDNAPAAQIKGALDKFEASQKVKQAALTAAQAALREVLSARQEALATMSGLLP